MWSNYKNLSLLPMFQQQFTTTFTSEKVFSRDEGAAEAYSRG